MLQVLPNSPEIIQKVMKAVRRKERAMLDREMREVSKWSGHGIRRVRMPDGSQIMFKVPRYSYFYWGQRLGFECWEDRQFVHEFLRDNPQCRVVSEAAKITVLSGWAPNKTVQAYNRFKALDTPPAAPAPDAKPSLILPPRFANA